MAYRPASTFVTQYVDTNGAPLNNGTLSAYIAGTSTPATMYADDLGTAAGSIITLNARGEPEVSGNTIVIWLDADVTYKFTLRASDGSSIWTVDGIPSYDVAVSVVNSYIGTDPFYWKPVGQALFGYTTGQSLTEPDYPMHPDAVPLVRCEGVLIWSSDGENDNWDFRVFDPDIPRKNDFSPYDAIDNPNGRPSTIVDGKLRWDKPYTGYGGDALASWWIGLAIQLYEMTGRKVYLGNTAWGGRSSFHWFPGAAEGDPYGQCSYWIDYHMPAMQARLAELEPDLDNLLWDFFAFNQSSTDAGIEAYGYPPEVYVNNWSAFLDHVGEVVIDGYGQPIPMRWMDPYQCIVTMLERTKREENFPWWNGQELLLEERQGQMQMVTSARRKIWDTEGVDGVTGTLPESPAYNLHFWGDVCIDYGRDVARSMLASGCGKARTEVLFQQHNTSTKPIRGVYTFTTNALGGISDPGAGNAGSQGTTSISISRTDAYGDDVPLEEIETGDLIYFVSRADRTSAYSATINAITVEAGYVGFTTSASDGVPPDGYFIEIEVIRRVYLTETVDGETEYYSDARYRAPYRRVAIGYDPGSVANATISAKAHDEEGHLLRLESHVDGATRMVIDAYLRDAVERIFLEFSHSAAIVFKGVLNTIDTLDSTTGENKPAITFANGYPLPNNAVYGSIRAVSNATAIALSGTTPATAMWNTNHNASGLTVDESTGSITVYVAGRYRVYLGLQSGTTTANERTAVYISINGTPSSYFGVVMSIGSVYFNGVAVEGTFPLASNDVIDVDFVPLGSATTITVANAELYVELLELA